MGLSRNASRQPSFFGEMMDAKAILFLLVFAFWPSWFTIKISLAGILFYAALSHFNLTADVLYRKLLTKLRGGTVYATPLYMKKRRFVSHENRQE